MSILISYGRTLCASGRAAPSACSLHPPNDKWMNVEQWWNATIMLNAKWSTVMSPTAIGPPHSPHDLPWKLKLWSQRWEVGDTDRLSYSTAQKLWLLYVVPSETLHILLTQSSIWISWQTVPVFLNNTTWIVVVTAARCVLSEVGTNYMHIYVSFKLHTSPGQGVCGPNLYWPGSAITRLPFNSIFYYSLIVGLIVRLTTQIIMKIMTKYFDAPYTGLWYVVIFIKLKR